MFDREMVNQILKGVGWLNEKMGMWAIIIPIVFTIVVIYLLYKAYKKPSKKRSISVLVAFALIYVFGGYTIFIGKDFMGATAAIGGAVGLWSVSVFLILDIIFGWTTIQVPQKKYLKILSWSLIFAGIFFYPILELILGFHYPNMVFFGAECPTTIALIGILIGAIPKTNKPLLILVSINAILTGGSVALHGAPFDALYALAGIIGAIMIAINFKALFLQKKKV